MSGVLKQGFMTKEGAIRHNWKKRWFVLWSDSVAYYKAEKDVGKKDKELGSFKLNEVSTVNPTNYKKQQFCLAVATHKRTYYMCAETEADMRGWQEAVQNQVDVIKGRPAGTTAASSQLKKNQPTSRPAAQGPTSLHSGMAPSGAGSLAPLPSVDSGKLPESSATGASTGTAAPAVHVHGEGAVSESGAAATNGGGSAATADLSGPALATQSADPIIDEALKTMDLGPDTAEKVTADDFDMITVIGQGSFGKVVQVRSKKNGQIYAMKMLNKRSIVERGEVEHTKAEKEILQTVKHPFLMCLHYSFQTPDKLYLVMDFVNGGEMFYHLQQEHTFDNLRSKFYAAEIVLGLEYLHQHGIVYRDLKPENLLLDADGHIKMTDFGLSKQGLNDPNARTKTFCGTPEYLAPEVLQGQEYGKAVDWWSLGTLIFEMLTGLPPFYDEDVQRMYAQKMTAELEVPEHVDPNAADLIAKFLDRNPTTRLQDARSIKAHPWFSEINWEDLAAKRVTPPYKPPVNDAGSIACIDEGFLEMTLSDVKSNPNDNAQAHFDDFTYKGAAPAAN